MLEDVKTFKAFFLGKAVPQRAQIGIRKEVVTKETN